jgi:hypothetical protein
MSRIGDTDFDQLMRTLTENFNVLADEVQLLSDRKTVLEHKLRFAHEQVCTTHNISLFAYRPRFVMRHLALDMEPLLVATTDNNQIIS